MSTPTVERGRAVDNLVDVAARRVEAATSARVLAGSLGAVTVVAGVATSIGALVNGLSADGMWMLGRSLIILALVGLLLAVGGTIVLSWQWRPITRWIRVRQQLSQARSAARQIERLVASRESVSVLATHTDGWDLLVGTSRVEVRESGEFRSETALLSRQSPKIHQVLLRGRGTPVRHEEQGWTCRHHALGPTVLRATCRWKPDAL